MDRPVVPIESSLPKPWEEEHSFNDVLYDWMTRAPWFAISAAAHLLVYFILSAVPWAKFGSEKGKTFEAKIEQAPEEIPEEPEEEIEEEIVEDPVDEPVLQDAEVVEQEQEDFQEAEGDPDFLSDSNFEQESFNDVIGIGGGAGGKFGQRGLGHKGLKARGGSGIEQNLADALEWLKAHQAPDGHWDAEGFSAECGKIGSGVCGGPGNPTHSVGVTGLALLAFLGDGNTTSKGPYKAVVSKGVAWLRSQQDLDTGLIGEDTSHEFIYDHAIATLAVCEAYYFSKSPIYKGVAQRAINYIARAQNPYSGWRYDVPPSNDSDTSVTGWMIFALTSAQEAGLTVDPAALEGGLAWIDDATDTTTGRVGYQTRGSLSSRTPANEKFPRKYGEAMTAVGLLCRVFLHQDRSTELEGVKILEKHAELLTKTLPRWEEYGCDMYYWYYGTYAMFQIGGDGWKKWNRAMKEAVLEHQSTEGDEKGSWDPVGPWGFSGGRVYSTALMTLCIEVYFRYGNVLGAR
ncbi:MAG TPA: hypothetical protein ENJ09_12770 [Planctomycetes bacterium]|nr:hypothetical protein [Planctomycetota bacterium]